MNNRYMTAEMVAEVLKISSSSAYKIIRQLNEELNQKGYITIAGRIPTKYFNERCYC